MPPNEAPLEDLILDPVSFFIMATGFSPYPYQEEILLDSVKQIIIKSGRQLGKTEVIAVKILHFAILNPRKQVLVIAPTMRQSKILFDKIDSIFKRVKSLYKLVVVKRSDYLKLDNGSEIYCLPSGEGDTIRGFSPDMLVKDEAAYIKDKVYFATEPMLLVKDGQYVLISTPAGKIGKFYEHWVEENGWSKYDIPLTKCPMITPEKVSDLRSKKTDIEFRQEYMAEFIEQLDTYFPMTLIKESLGGEEESGPEQGFDYFMGLDVARFGADETVWTIVKYSPKDESYSVVRIYNEEKGAITSVVGKTINYQGLWKCKWIYVDEGGLGAGAFDSLKAQGFPVRPVDFGKNNLAKGGDNNRIAIYKNLKWLMENKKIRLLNHSRLILQIQQMIYEFTEQGHLKLRHPDNGHDDYPDSLALALSSNITGGDVRVIMDRTFL